MNSVKKCHLIPPGEQRCLWMTAGVLSYQLCDRNFDCDHCPLEAAMRRRDSVSSGARVDEHPVPGDGPPAAATQALPQGGIRYSRNHWWAQTIGPGTVRLGIEPGLARVLLPVKGIVFPQPRQTLQQGQACIWLVMDQSTLALEAPVTGVVRKVNRDLIHRPHLLYLKPVDEGWLCELETEREREAAGMGLMSCEEALPKYESDHSRLMAALTGALRGKRPPVGTTLADGGEPLQHFADILGPVRYFSMVRQAFGWARH